jgi:hypothetical protein
LLKQYLIKKLNLINFYEYKYVLTHTEMLLLSKCNIVKAEQPDISGKLFKLLDCNIILSAFRNSPNGGNISN